MHHVAAAGATRDVYKDVLLAAGCTRLNVAVCQPGNKNSVSRAKAISKVEIYSSRACGFCQMAKQLILSKSVQFKEYDVTLDPSKRVEMHQRSKGGYTVPQIFIGGTHIGGCNDLYRLDQRGKLDILLSGDQTVS